MKREFQLLVVNIIVLFVWLSCIELLLHGYDNYIAQSVKSINFQPNIPVSSLLIVLCPEEDLRRCKNNVKADCETPRIADVCPYFCGRCKPGKSSRFCALNFVAPINLVRVADICRYHCGYAQILS